MMLGRVDDVDGHYIATKFFALIVPTGSIYVTNESAVRHGNVTTFSWTGVPLRWQWKSVALAYPRVWFPVLALAWPFLMHWGQSLSATTSVTWATSIAFIVMSGLAHVPGRLAEQEKARLRVLGSIAGVRADPSKLPSFTRAAKLEFLASLMLKGGIPMDAESILYVLDEIPSPALPLVYAYARYAGDDPAWQACAARVYEKLERGDL